MSNIRTTPGFHDKAIYTVFSGFPLLLGHWDTKFTYQFENFFHPFIGELIEQLNKESLPGIFDPAFLEKLQQVQNPENNTFFAYFKDYYSKPQAKDDLAVVEGFPKEIDVSTNGPYANYNWELLFHIPLAIAVHLSKNQRFAEAQRWFHYIFDPTDNDQSVDPPLRFWKFLAFRKPEKSKRIEEIVRLLSIPKEALNDAEQKAQDEAMQGYSAILDKPFQPHAVARTRPIAYQYCVVMKYLDNLIAWGDHLFQQDTVETLNEATQIYILAANLLGPRPQRVPPRGKIRPKTFAQLKTAGLGPIGNALTELEGQFPFNLAPPPPKSGTSQTAPLFGIGRALYFCIPRNDKLLGYWDTVGDRLFKIRHCMNIQGVVRPLALFDPPLDPGILVKAAAAGIDIGSVVNGLNQPASPVRALFLIQKALELAGEVRGLGGALLSALEKGDAEHLALVRQSHEIKIQQLAQEVRFLQWKSAEEATQSLLTSRKTALERLRFYQRLLGLPADPNAADIAALDRRELTEENFDEVYGSLVGQYDKTLTPQKLATLRIAGSSSPAQQSGASGQGKLFLNINEDAELNSHLPAARNSTLAASASNTLAAGFAYIPDTDIDLHYWGIGGKIKLPIGTALVAAAKIVGDISGIISGWEREQAGIASRTAGYERRADDWLQQYNLAAHELMQNGRQILTSLLAEQIARREYLNLQQQIKNAEDVDLFLHDKFTNEELYGWMQSEISRLYYEYYRFAFDTARKAEKTMKQELLRPELDDQTFVKFNYWDDGRKGLLSGEALHLDLKRMEMAYHEHNRRELELTRHVSLRQLDPLALLVFRTTGSCTFTIPEWLYDLDCPGHYMRRIKSVALTIPSVAGPYTSVNCTVSLLRSSVRKIPTGNYLREEVEDARFIDYSGAIQSIVTSGANNDSGLFETNLRDERFLPFEGAGAESTWKLELPKDYPAFDYATITDVVLHIRYTARQGVEPGKVRSALAERFQPDGEAKLALLFSLKHDFPTEWAKFVSGNTDFTATIRRDYFPYFTNGKTINIEVMEVYDGGDTSKHRTITEISADVASEELKDPIGYFTFKASSDQKGILTRTAKEVFLLIRYTIG